MREKRARSQVLLPRVTLVFSVFFFSCAALLAGGCSIRRRPRIPWATAVQVRPVLQTRSAAAEETEDSAPDLKLGVPPFAAVLVPMRGGPPRPRGAAGSSTAGSGTADAEKPAAEEPRIAPQLTPEETVVAQQETNQSLSVAEKNLASVSGKRLNASQTDLVSKIRGFLKDAREAAQNGDWSRARSLAKKAQVLSEELAGSS